MGEIDPGRASLFAGNPLPQTLKTNPQRRHPLTSQQCGHWVKRQSRMPARESHGRQEFAMGHGEKQAIGEPASHHGERRHGVDGGSLDTTLEQRSLWAAGGHWALRRPAGRTVQNCTVRRRNIIPPMSLWCSISPGPSQESRLMPSRRDPRVPFAPA